MLNQTDQQEMEKLDLLFGGGMQYIKLGMTLVMMVLASTLEQILTVQKA